jgi:hypothetical protein
MTAGVAQVPLPPPTTVAAEYETLRMAALGEALPPAARSGLMLFLSRGMWAWARTVAARSIRKELAAAAPSRDPIAACARDAVTRVLAALAIKTPERRAP